MEIDNLDAFLQNLHKKVTITAGRGEYLNLTRMINNEIKTKKNIKQYEIKRIKMEDGKYEVWEHLDIIIHQLHCMISFYL